MAITKVTTPVTDFDKSTSLPGLKIPSGDNSNQPAGAAAEQGMIRNDTEETVDSSDSAIAHYNGTAWQYFAATESADNPNLKMYLDASDTTSYPGTGTTWFDLTTNGNNGTINGATWNALGYFNFNQNRITIPSTATSAFDVSNRTLSTWIYITNNGGSRVPIILQGSNLNYGMIYFELNMSASTIKYQMGYGSVTTSFALNTWYNLTIVQVGASSEAFFNGVSIGTAVSGNNTLSGTQFQMGGTITSSSLDFSGNISKFSLYDKALTQAEITALYNEGR